MIGFAPNAQPCPARRLALGEHPVNGIEDMRDVYPYRGNGVVSGVQVVKIWFGADDTPASAERDEPAAVTRPIGPTESVWVSQNRFIATVTVRDEHGEVVETYTVLEPGVVRRTESQCAIGGRCPVRDAPHPDRTRMLIVLDAVKKA